MWSEIHSKEFHGSRVGWYPVQNNKVWVPDERKRIGAKVWELSRSLHPLSTGRSSPVGSEWTQVWWWFWEWV